jgi:hypothetical protein
LPQTYSAYQTQDSSQASPQHCGAYSQTRAVQWPQEAASGAPGWQIECEQDPPPPELLLELPLLELLELPLELPLLLLLELLLVLPLLLLELLLELPVPPPEVVCGPMHALCWFDQSLVTR